MRIARKLMLLAVMAMAVMALTASSASAVAWESGNNTDATVVTEPGGSACVKCPLRAVGEVRLSGHLFGIEATISDCDLILEGHVANNGEGSVETAALSDHVGDDCTVTPCSLPWRVHAEEDSPGVFSLHTEFCITNPDTGDRRCLFEIPVTEGSGNSHTYTSVFNGTAGSPPDIRGVNHLACQAPEIEGQLQLVNDAAHPEIELL